MDGARRAEVRRRGGAARATWLAVFVAGAVALAVYRIRARHALLDGAGPAPAGSAAAALELRAPLGAVDGPLAEFRWEGDRPGGGTWDLRVFDAAGAEAAPAGEEREPLFAERGLTLPYFRPRVPLAAGRVRWEVRLFDEQRRVLRAESAEAWVADGAR